MLISTFDMVRYILNDEYRKTEEGKLIKNWFDNTKAVIPLKENSYEAKRDKETR